MWPSSIQLSVIGEGSSPWLSRSDGPGPRYPKADRLLPTSGVRVISSALGLNCPLGWLWHRITELARRSRASRNMSFGSATVPCMPPWLTRQRSRSRLPRSKRSNQNSSCGRSATTGCSNSKAARLPVMSGLSAKVWSRRWPSSSAAMMLMALASPTPFIRMSSACPIAANLCKSLPALCRMTRARSKALSFGVPLRMRTFSRPVPHHSCPWPPALASAHGVGSLGPLRYA